MPDPRVTVELLDRATFALKSNLSESYNRQWQDVLNDVGFGKVTMQNDDADLPLVEYGDFLRFSLDGAPRFLSIVEAMNKVEIATGEEVDEVTEISGRGALAYLEDAVVYPDFFILDNSAPFCDARTFNFGAFDTIGNGTFVAPYDWGDRLATPNPPNPYQNIPPDFPAVFSHWIGPQAPAGPGDDMPEGDWYYIALLFGIPSQLYRLYIGYDDAIDLWIDNVPILQNEGTTLEVTKTVDLFLTAAIHFINVRVTNRDPAGPPSGPTGITMSLCSLNPDGSADIEYWATDPADPNQFVSPYPPAAPAFTAGHIVDALCRFEPQVLRDDVDGIGAIPLISMGFTDDADSNGVPWADLITPAFQIGIDCLTVIKQLSESYFDIRIDPATFTLNLYQTFGTAAAAAFTEAVNITELKHAGTF